MGNGSGLSRGDRNRNARLARLRAVVPATKAIVGIDLADAKQMVVVCDHDSKVLARKTFRCRAWDLGTALDWAAARAATLGFAGVTVACEPTGHRWQVLTQLAADRSMPFACVQPLVTTSLGPDASGQPGSSTRSAVRSPAAVGSDPACVYCAACSPRSPIRPE